MTANGHRASTVISPAQGRGSGGGGARWTLQPSIIPQMELRTLRLQVTRKAEGVTVPVNSPAQKNSRNRTGEYNGYHIT
jgi:hypothetical protein